MDFEPGQHLNVKVACPTISLRHRYAMSGTGVSIVCIELTGSLAFTMRWLVLIPIWGTVLSLGMRCLPISLRSLSRYAKSGTL